MDIGTTHQSKRLRTEEPSHGKCVSDVGNELDEYFSDHGSEHVLVNEPEAETNGNRTAMSKEEEDVGRLEDKEGKDEKKDDEKKQGEKVENNAGYRMYHINVETPGQKKKRKRNRNRNRNRRRKNKNKGGQNGQGNNQTNLGQPGTLGGGSIPEGQRNQSANLSQQVGPAIAQSANASALASSLQQAGISKPSKSKSKAKANAKPNPEPKLTPVPKPIAEPEPTNDGL
eukprot:CAMPEP_0184691224 /NCGR_PEP_ID=MMETSP0313-20130426/134_1 /TAXON_ID=2792 /ORGANISM="Porphyridium aerugineum, Strain SAG 1380-2" /LENGTH=227 /DNA_ID=CAMNT_0027148901 /DNA_START=100 /DNA_END=780 /DNA_ORIENTATION=+